MPDLEAISNTGPIIAFSKIGRLDLLTSLFSTVLIPEMVYEELKAGLGMPGSAVGSLTGVQIVNPAQEPDELLRSELDSGEASVIRVALEHPNAEVLIDERKARRLAVSVYGLNVLGTGGLLVRAKRRGLIQFVKPLLTEIHGNGYYLSDRLREGILLAANEL